MRACQPRWILACATLSALMAQTAEAITISMTTWKSSPIEVGDKRFTWIANDIGLKGASVTIEQDLDTNTHFISIGNLSQAHDTHELLYEVEVFTGSQLMWNVGIDSDTATSDSVTSVVTKTVYANVDDLVAETNALATLTSLDGDAAGPVSFTPSSVLFIRDTVDETGGRTVFSFSNTIGQTVPEPSTWALSTLACGGLALVRRRRKRGLQPTPVA